MGAVSSAGADKKTLWQKTLNQESSIQVGLGKITIPNDSQKERALFYSLCAAKEAMEQAGWTEFNENDGFLLATTTGLVSTWDEKLIGYFQGITPLDSVMEAFQNERLGILLDKICGALNFKGKRQLLTTACSASTHALGLAALWLKTGQVKRVLVGGIEIISPLTVEGFRSFQLLSDTICTPFQKGRKGINLSDAAAFLCLENTPSSKPLAELAGVGFSTDAYHMTAPHPEGEGSFRAMKAAIQMAGILPSEISWVHAHGTGSEHNDLSEGKALERLFEGNTPPVTSTKAVHGHSLAASGALESILCVMALQEQKIPQTLGLTEPDERIKINHATTSSLPLHFILKNTLGFGGANGSLVFKKEGESK